MGRPPQLTDKPLTGGYRTAVGQNLRGGLSVSRADVAHLMLAALGQPETIGQAIGIAKLAAVLCLRRRQHHFEHYAGSKSRRWRRRAL